LRRQDQRHTHRRGQPTRRPRPGPAASWPLRPPDPRPSPGYEGPSAHPRGPCRRQAAGRRSRPLQIAERTPAFSGADLANVLNEAALLTARENAKVIDNRILDEAIDRVIAGPQKRTRLMNDMERLVTADHEGGHA